MNCEERATNFQFPFDENESFTFTLRKQFNFCNSIWAPFPLDTILFTLRLTLYNPLEIYDRNKFYFVLKLPSHESSRQDERKKSHWIWVEMKESRRTWKTLLNFFSLFLLSLIPNLTWSDILLTWSSKRNWVTCSTTKEKVCFSLSCFRIFFSVFLQYLNVVGFGSFRIVFWLKIPTFSEHVELADLGL